MNNLSKLVLFLVLTVASPMLAIAGPVDVNTADAETISAELQGVGLTKAQAIVEYRETHGPFKSLEDLTMVKGIGARTVEINRANILFKPVATKGK